jgi:uncharacterized RDD family membrane protein YckC
VAKLILNPNAPNRREIALSRSAMLTIGRDPSNDLVLPDAMVSRRHAVVEHRGGDFLVRDCRSANGSVVNGERVSERALRDGDLLAIGSIRLQFREDPPASASGKVLVHPSARALRCRSCGADHRRADVFCRECGAQLGERRDSVPRVRCTACGNAVRLPAHFCNECGATLPSDAPRIEPPPMPARHDTGPVARDDASLDPPPSHVASGSMAMAPERRPATDPSHRHLPRLAPRSPELEPERCGRSLAPPGRRLAAALVDLVFVSSAQAVMLAPVLWYWWNEPAPRTPAEVSFAPVLASVALVPLAIVAGCLYHVYFWSVKGATPGMELLELRVESDAGRSPIGVDLALLRLLGYALGAASLGLGFLPVVFGSAALHDRVAGTRVTRAEARV